MNAIAKQINPKTIGEEAKRKAVANDRRRQDMIMWIIYGG